MRKRAVTAIEIADRVVVSPPHTEDRRPCPVCAAEAMITPEEAAALARVPVRAIYAGIEAEGTHFLETPDRLLLLCAKSLFRRKRFGELEKLVWGAEYSGRTLKRIRVDESCVLK